jgi:heat shock protein HslJ
MIRRVAALTVAALLIAVAMVACGGGDDEAAEPTAPAEPASPPESVPPEPSEPVIEGPPSLQGVVWQWQGSQYSDGSEAVPDDPALYTIEFAEDGSAFILANCNTVRATYEENEGSLSIVLGASTRVACPEGSLDGEYLRDLEGAAIAFSDGTGDLLIDIKFDSGTMRFSPAA